jgi:hypothetical protein
MSDITSSVLATEPKGPSFQECCTEHAAVVVKGKRGTNDGHAANVAEWIGGYECVSRTIIRDVAAIITIFSSQVIRSRENRPDRAGDLS